MIPRHKRLILSTTNPKKGPPFIRSPYLYVYRIKNNLGYNRLAVIVSKNCAPLSVDRHRLKRQLLQTMSHWPEKSYDLLLVPQKKFAESTAKNRTRILKEIALNILS
ncbi:MAG: ribonuclease P protein component [Anaplasmataceae bacterium]|nr:ribonuclease P protein component [Anaplasmataceae bacterium]